MLRARPLCVVLLALLAVHACGGVKELSSPPLAVDNTPAQLSAASDSIVVGDAGRPLTEVVIVAVRNRGGAPLVGVDVSFVVDTASRGIVSQSVRPTGQDGKAFVTWTLGTGSRTQTLVASVAGLSPVRFTATVRTGPVAQVLRVSPEPSMVIVNTIVSQPILVKAVDIVGTPVPNASLSVEVASGGGSLSQTSFVTNDSGVANITGWRLGTRTGSNTIGIHAGFALSATATVFAEPDVAATIRFKQTDTLILNRGDTATLGVSIADRFGNPAVPKELLYLIKDGRKVDFVSGARETTVRAVGGGSTQIWGNIGVDSSRREITVVNHPTEALLQLHGPLTQTYQSSIANGAVVIGGGLQVFRETIASMRTSSFWDGFPAGTPMPATVNDVAAMPDGRSVVAATADSALTFVDAVNRITTGAIRIGDVPTRIVMTGDASRAFVLAGSTIVGVNLTTRAVTYTTRLAAPAQWLLHDASSGRLYAATPAGAVSVVDGGSGTVVRTFTIAPTMGIELSLDGRWLYNLLPSPSVLEVISTATGTRTTTVNLLSDDSRRLIRAADGLMLYVATRRPMNTSYPYGLVMLDLANPAAPTIRETDFLLWRPVSLAMDPRGAWLFVGTDEGALWLYGGAPPTAAPLTVRRRTPPIP
jgi:hypothetical protein